MYFILVLKHASDDAYLSKNLLKTGIKKGVDKKVPARVDDDKKLVDGNRYLDPLLAVSITTLVPNFFESSEIKKLVHVQYDSQRVA